MRRAGGGDDGFETNEQKLTFEKIRSINGKKIRRRMTSVIGRGLVSEVPGAVDSNPTDHVFDWYYELGLGLGLGLGPDPHGQTRCFKDVNKNRFRFSIVLFRHFFDHYMIIMFPSQCPSHLRRILELIDLTDAFSAKWRPLWIPRNRSLPSHFSTPEQFP